MSKCTFCTFLTDDKNPAPTKVVPQSLYILQGNPLLPVNLAKAARKVEKQAFNFLMKMGSNISVMPRIKLVAGINLGNKLHVSLIKDGGYLLLVVSL